MIKEQLKKLSREFLQAELWEDLTDSDVFGVELKAFCQRQGIKLVKERLPLEE